MANDSRIGILIQSRHEAQGFTQAEASLRGLDSAAGTLSKGLGGLAVAGGVAGLVALGQAAVSATVDLSRAAAQAGDMRAVFDDMAAGAGESGKQMLSAMQAASGGMVSNAELIANANRAMLLGVADSSDEMAQLLDVARVRGQAMGLSLQEAFGDVVTGIGRMSPLILDNLGITVDMAAASDAYAASLGRTAASLTEAEKKQALLNAVIADTKPLIDSSVAAGNDLMAPFERMDAAISNTKQSLGELFGPAVAVVAENIAAAAAMAAEAVREMGQADAGDIQGQIEGTQRVLAGMLEARQRLRQDMAAGVEGFDVHELAELEDSIREVEAKLEALGVDLQHTFDVDTGLREHAEALQDLGLAAQFARPPARELKTDFQSLSDTIRDTVLASTDLGERGMQPLSDHLRSGAAATNQLNATLANSPAVFGMFAAAAAAAGADVSQLIGLIDQASGALNQLQGARDSAVRGLASNLARQVEEGLISREQAAAMFDTGVDAAESSMQQYADMMATGQKSTDDLILEQELLFQTVDDGSQAIDEANAAAKRYARTLASDTSDAARQAERAFGDLKSKVSSVLGEALGDIGGVNPDEILGNLGLREDAIAENARRLADIAANGFKDQDWLGEFANEVPDIFKALQEAGDPRAAAAQMLKEFQQGFRPELLDRDQLKDAVKDMILSEQAKAQLAEEIATELAGELGTSVPDALETAKEALGVRGGGGDEEAASDLGAGIAAGIGNAGTVALQKLNEQLRSEENLKLIEGSGEKAGEKWGAGFLRVVAENVPTPLIDLLVQLVTPGVMAQQRQAASLTGAR